MKRQRSSTFITIAALMGIVAIVLGGCGKEEKPEEKSEQKTAQESTMSEKIEELIDSEYLLAVDGYGVTEEEFLMFLRDQKAATANYYWTNYEMQPNGEFWKTEVDGQTPLEYAKERALSSVIEAKAEFILADERGILEYQDYDGMIEDMEAENTKRAEQIANGETVYGNTEYTPFTYYQYMNGNARAELEKNQIEITEPTEEKLKQVYEENKETFSLGQVFTYTVHYADGTEETVEQNTREIGKEETTKEDLIYNYFTYMQPGETVENYVYQGKDAVVELNSVENLGYASFEESEKSLRAFYARAELNQIIADKVSNVEVRINKERYGALQMP